MKKLIALLLMVNMACQNDNRLDSKTNLIEDKNPTITDVNVGDRSLIKKALVAESVIDSVENRIYNLKKIQALNRQCKVSMLTQVSSELDTNYTFKVGFNRADRFETRYIFSFNKSQSVVFYYNTLNDKFIDIDKWDVQ
jgi:hypothetical protein